MSSLNILCAICSEFFKNTDAIFGTRCGHVFHKHCLFHWIQRSATCPQCRRHCSRHHCHQMYLNFIEPINCDNELVFEVPKIYEWLYIDQFTEHQDLTEYALKLGQDEEGCDIYAARGRFQGDLIPGNYVSEKRKVIVPWGFESHWLSDDIEILDISNDDAEYKWVAASNGAIPKNAFATGRTVLRDILYTARVQHEGRILYGKLHQRYNMAYVPYKDKEICNSNYEVLVRIPKTKATPLNDQDEVDDDLLGILNM